MNSDNVKGNLKDLGGKAQEAAGKATGDKELEAKGNANQAAGKVQNAWGEVKKEARDTADDVKDAFNKQTDKHKVDSDTDADRRLNRDEVA